METVESSPPYRPQMSDAGLTPTHPVSAVDEYGAQREQQIAGEFPLTLKVDGREVVTLMTLGTHPEELTLGYLRNQQLIGALDNIATVTVDWEREQVQVTTQDGTGISDWQEKLQHRIVTTGCGQGTVFGYALNKLYDQPLPLITLRQSQLYGLLHTITQYNQIYKKAGAVHGCALCCDLQILRFIEDVGRHNAADAIAGYMWLERIRGGDKLFYTTGRLTSEIVMKAANMGIPAILSRSGITHMGLELAQDLGIVLIARAKGRHFLVYNGAEQLIFDAIPAPRPPSVANPQLDPSARHLEPPQRDGSQGEEIKPPCKP